MKEWLNKFKALPWYFKNIFVVILVFFVVWMLFFDKNNFFYQFELSSKVDELEEQKQYFTQEIEELDKLKTELFSTEDKKEKFAREKYFMKKDNEDVFIIVEKD